MSFRFFRGGMNGSLVFLTFLSMNAPAQAQEAEAPPSEEPAEALAPQESPEVTQPEAESEPPPETGEEDGQTEGTADGDDSGTTESEATDPPAVPEAKSAEKDATASAASALGAAASPAKGSSSAPPQQAAKEAKELEKKKQDAARSVRKPAAPPVATDPAKSVEAAENAVAVSKAVELRSYKPWEELGEKKSDWIRTTSGEWLRGDIQRLRDDELEIDSEEFDLQTLDWADVADIHSPNRFLYVLDDKSVYAGTAELADGRLVVHTSEGPRAFKKERLMSVVPEHRSEISKWAFKLTLGGTVRQGNTESVDLSGYSRLRREDAFNRLTFEYNGAYGIVSEEVNAHRHRGNAEWNIFVSPLFYVTPLYGQGQYDKFQNIKFRGIALAGGGIHAVDISNFKLDLEVAGGYVSTTYISVEPGAATYLDGALVQPRLVLDWDITDDIEFELDWSSSLLVTDIDSSFHHGVARLEIELTDILDLDLSAIYDRFENPVEDEEGRTPVKNDLATTVGLGLELD